jgi:cell division protein FtsB
MHRLLSAIAASRRLRRRLLGVGMLALVFYLAFLDSHSILQRVQMNREIGRLHVENEHLERQVEQYEERLRAPLSDEIVEKVAREQYGMRRSGETVYPVEQED